MKYLTLALLAALHVATSAAPLDVEHDGHLPFSWWPPQLPFVSRAYQCFVPPHAHGRGSVVVWTDRKRQVLAVAPALEGQPIPGYALAMVNQATGNAGDPIRIATGGFAVAVRGRSASLQVGTALLACVPTSED